MNEDKATRYHRLGRRAGILSTIWTAAILLALLFTGASLAFREWAASVTGANAALIVAFYVLILSLLFDVATLPFSLYRGFLLERRYGLSTETFGHWWQDHVKAVAIGVMFAELGAAFVYFALRTWPASWWAIAGAGYAVVAIVLVNLAPVVLLPLFFSFKPLEKETLRERLKALAAKAGTRIMGVYEWTLSDRTKKANAALTGIGNTRRILLSDTLLAEYSDDEIEVILAHELAHHVHKDIWTSVVVDTALTFAGLSAAHFALQAAVPVFGLEGIADPAGHSDPAAHRRRNRLVRQAAAECCFALARAAGRFVCADADGESVGVHHRHAAARPAESRRRRSVKARAGVFLHPSADQRASAGGAILGAIGATGATGAMSAGVLIRAYTRVAIFGRSPVRSSLNSITSRLDPSSRHIDPRATVTLTPCRSGGEVVDRLIMSCVPMCVTPHLSSMLLPRPGKPSTLPPTP